MLTLPLQDLSHCPCICLEDELYNGLSKIIPHNISFAHNLNSNRLMATQELICKLPCMLATLQTPSDRVRQRGCYVVAALSPCKPNIFMNFLSTNSGYTHF